MKNIGYWEFRSKRRQRRPLGLHLRKRVAQAGVILFVSAQASPAVPFIWTSVYPLLFTLLSGLVLLIAALLPDRQDETWGSMWPLVGYDNAIVALYVRGPWLQRFGELEEAEAQTRTATAMREWF